MVVAVACSPKTSSGGGDATIAYVTNGIDPFWDLCAAGVHQAEKKFGVRCEIHMPTKGLADQKSIMETLLAKGIKGMAVSPVDAENQTPSSMKLPSRLCWSLMMRMHPRAIGCYTLAPIITRRVARLANWSRRRSRMEAR